METTVRICDYHELSEVVDITNAIGSFRPFILIYINNIKTMDVSGCRFIVATDFVDCIVACRNL